MNEAVFTIEPHASFAVEGGGEAMLVIDSPQEVTVEVADPEAFTVLTEREFTVVHAGQQGPEGKRGPVGLDLHYEHDQPTPAVVWVINHNLGKFPSVQLMDSTGRVIGGLITHLDRNTTTATFTALVGGRATCN